MTNYLKLEPWSCLHIHFTSGLLPQTVITQPSHLVEWWVSKETFIHYILATPRQGFTAKWLWHSWSECSRLDNKFEIGETMIMKVLSKSSMCNLRVSLLLFRTLKVLCRTYFFFNQLVKSHFQRNILSFRRENLCIAMLFILTVRETLNYFAKLMDIPW